MRAALGSILGSIPQIALVGEAADGTEVAAAVTATAAQVVLMDIRAVRAPWP